MVNNKTSNLTTTICLGGRGPRLGVEVLRALPHINGGLLLANGNEYGVSGGGVRLSHCRNESINFYRCTLGGCSLRFATNFFRDVNMSFIFRNSGTFPTSLRTKSIISYLHFTTRRLKIVVRASAGIAGVRMLGCRCHI